MPDQPDQDEWLTVAEITRELKVHEETVRRWIRSGALPATLLRNIRTGYRVRRSDLERFMGTNETASED